MKFGSRAKIADHFLSDSAAWEAIGEIAQCLLRIAREDSLAQQEFLNQERRMRTGRS
jgi:hypothetical protein